MKMNKFRPVVMLLALCVLAPMASCTKDGVYTPKQKIKRVYNSSTSTEKHLSESWDWDGNLLEAINHYTSSGTLNWTENFSYDGKRLVRVDDYLNSEYTSYEYDGKYLKTANYYYRNSLEATTTYTYSSGKLSKMEVMFYDSKSVTKDLFRSSYTFFPSEIVEVFDHCFAKTVLRNQGKGLYILNYQFTWDGDNVSRIVATEDSDMATVNLQYDNYNNPLKGFHSLYSDVDDDIEVVLWTSKNNIVRMIVNYDGENEVESFTYQYNKDNYPTMRIMRYSDEADYQYITYYEYE